jgi:hypothetical protein
LALLSLSDNIAALPLFSNSIASYNFAYPIDELAVIRRPLREYVAVREGSAHVRRNVRGELCIWPAAAGAFCPGGGNKAFDDPMAHGSFCGSFLKRRGGLLRRHIIDADSKFMNLAQRRFAKDRRPRHKVRRWFRLYPQATARLAE